jgi:hypothetical protein
MLLSLWITVIAAIAAWCGAAVALWLVRRAKALSSSVALVPRSLDTRLAAVIERQDELTTAVEGLLNREKMRRVRKGAGLDTATEPDPHRDPAAWKAHMRRRQALGANDA